MLRSSLTRVKKDLLVYTINRVSLLDPTSQMNSAYSLSTIGTSHVGTPCSLLHNIKTRATTFLNRSRFSGKNEMQRLNVMSLCKVTSGSISGAAPGESRFLSGPTPYSSTVQRGDIAVHAGGGGDSGGKNGNEGNDGGDDGEGSSPGSWFGLLWVMYLAQLDKNPVCLDD